jgi:Rap1a immunity proteins
MIAQKSALALLIGLFVATAHAAGPSAERSSSAKFYLPGCKDFVAGKSNFYAGRCVGTIEALGAVSLAAKLFCPPESNNNLQRVRVVITYIEARLERINEDFVSLANEAMTAAWPCKN